jgi:hypothetical protein
MAILVPAVTIEAMQPADLDASIIIEVKSTDGDADDSYSRRSG